ncbi:hypothetical protein Z517_09285 [Fonsecaea pedrosoi CBS 271.37]|uniref:Uncharacterized protein n=1 Tax=Fonsecaea pedrosoi CBS 271.37 TaxID=1442368 RepID=A0A0D2DGM4_9EURO|nr:uncharacterized protein Z517_09285 [Fonsecaea pedrosoi CBS 271.37]KIW76841.1 hypothetical protein Z517_09285 [Fonsecaea pedrosoi CBS 271.37]
MNVVDKYPASYPISKPDNQHGGRTSTSIVSPDTLPDNYVAYQWKMYLKEIDPQRLLEGGQHQITNTSTSRLHCRRALHSRSRDRVSNSSSRVAVVSRANQSGNVVTNERHLVVTRNSIIGQMNDASGKSKSQQVIVLETMVTKLHDVLESHSVEDEELDEVVAMIK